MNYPKGTVRRLARPEAQPVKKRSKYGAVKTAVDGIVFDSKRESARYVELKLRQKAGEIRNLRLQPHYTLAVAVMSQLDLKDYNRAIVDRGAAVCEYHGDFEYEENQGFQRGMMGAWQFVVEDVKGCKTDIYKLKKRMFEAQYGLTIRET